MVDLIAIAQGVNALKATSDILKAMMGLRDSAKLLEKTVELNRQILTVQMSLLEAQQEQATLVSTVREREEEIARLKAWDAEKENYKLVEVAVGSFAYVIKPEAQGGGPEVLICPTCYENAKKTILQARPFGMQRGPEGDMRSCPTCNTQVPIARNPQWKPSPERRW